MQVVIVVLQRSLHSRDTLEVGVIQGAMVLVMMHHCIFHQLLLVLQQGLLDTHKPVSMCVVPHGSCHGGGREEVRERSVLTV